MTSSDAEEKVERLLATLKQLQTRNATARSKIDAWIHSQQQRTVTPTTEDPNAHAQTNTVAPPAQPDITAPTVTAETEDNTQSEAPARNTSITEEQSQTQTEAMGPAPQSTAITTTSIAATQDTVPDEPAAEEEEREEEESSDDSQDDVALAERQTKIQKQLKELRAKEREITKKRKLLKDDEEAPKKKRKQNKNKNKKIIELDDDGNEVDQEDPSDVVKAGRKKGPKLAKAADIIPYIAKQLAEGKDPKKAAMQSREKNLRLSLFSYRQEIATNTPLIVQAREHVRAAAH